MLGLARGFSPDMFPGLVFWADGSRFAAVDGTAESTLANLSPTGSANNGTQPTGGNQPLFKMGVNGINSRGVLRFDGVDDFLLQPIDISGANTNFVAFRCRNVPGASSFQSIVNYKSPLAGNFFDEILLANFAGLQPYSFKSDFLNTGNSVGIADTLDTNPHVICTSYVGSNNTTPASYTCSLDGVVKTVIASGSFARTGTDKGAIGSRVTTANATSLQFNGDIGEIIRYNRQLSAYEQAVVVKYLRNGWGI